MIQLLGRATSGNVQKVIFLLEELGLPYERKDYGKQFDNTTTPEYAAMNPMKKVPTLVDGDTVVWQSNTILRYLANKTGSALYPAGPAQRSIVDRWMDCLGGPCADQSFERLEGGISITHVRRTIAPRASGRPQPAPDQETVWTGTS